MVTFRMASLSAVLFAALLAPTHCQAVADWTSTASLTIAVADFSGTEKEVGSFLADTLLTDLAQSDRLHLVERSEVQKALSKLKLQSTDLTQPQPVRQVGKLIQIDHLIVGSYLIRDNQLIINARLLDVHTGRVVSGGAANVTGARDSILPLVHRLAHLFHRRVTGEDFALEGEPDSHQAALSADTTQAPSVPEEEVPYTAVIIDMHGRRVQPARDWTPKIWRADGAVIWSILSANNVDPDYAADHGIITYAHSIEEARKLAVAGSHPLVLRAVSDTNRPGTDAVIGNPDAESLIRFNERDGFLDRGNIIFVVGTRK